MTRRSETDKWLIDQPSRRFCVATCLVLMVSICTGTSAQETEKVAPATVRVPDEIQNYRDQLFVTSLAIDGGHSEIALKQLEETRPEFRDWEYDYLLNQAKQGRASSESTHFYPGSAKDVVFSKDNQSVIFGRGKDVVIWNIAKQQQSLLQGHRGSIEAVALSPDGRKLATGGWDGKILVWDLESEQKILEYLGHNPEDRRPGAHETQVIRDLSFSPDGQEIVSAALVNSPFVTDVPPELKIWSVETGDTLTVLRGNHEWGRTGGILCVAFSPDGNRVATGSFDHHIRIWNARTGKEVRWIKGHSNNVLDVAFSPDGKQLASASTDGSVGVWDVKTGQEQLRLKGHDQPVFGVQFSHSGKRIVTGCCSQTVKIWDTSTGTELLSIPNSGATLRSIAISPDDHSIATANSGESGNPGVTVWNLP